jgi:nucleotide-binding universal stress UspA family protein
VGLKVLDIIERMGRRHGIHVATKIETGDVVEKILESIITDKIDLVVIGASRRLTVGFWARDSIAKEIIEKSPVPVVTMPVVKP